LGNRAELESKTLQLYLLKIRAKTHLKTRYNLQNATFALWNTQKCVVMAVS